MARTVLLKTPDETFTNDDELKTGFDGVAELDECGIPTGFIRDARLLKEDHRYRCRAGLEWKDYDRMWRSIFAKGVRAAVRTLV
jgi:hypothetical protein